MDADGTDQARVTNHPALDALPTWSPDSKLLAFVSERIAKGQRRLFVVRPDGTGARMLARCVRHVARLGSGLIMSARHGSLIVVMAVSILLLAAPAASRANRRRRSSTTAASRRRRPRRRREDRLPRAFRRPALGCQSRLRSRARLPPRQPGRRHRPRQFEHGPSSTRRSFDDQPPVAVRLHPRALDHPRRERGARAEQDELPVRRICSAARLERAAGAVYARRSASARHVHGARAVPRGGLREYTSADGGPFFVRPGPAFAATEHWAALVDDSGFGVGLVNRDVTGFAGIAGPAGRRPSAAT